MGYILHYLWQFHPCIQEIFYWVLTLSTRYCSSEKNTLVNKRDKIPDLVELMFYQKKTDNKHNKFMNDKVCQKQLSIMGKK